MPYTGAMTFSLRLAVLALLNPVVESDPATLTAWADNLDKAAASPAARGDVPARYRARAEHLRSLAHNG